MGDRLALPRTAFLLRSDQIEVSFNNIADAGNKADFFEYMILLVSQLAGSIHPNS